MPKGKTTGHKSLLISSVVSFLTKITSRLTCLQPPFELNLTRYSASMGYGPNFILNRNSSCLCWPKFQLFICEAWETKNQCQFGLIWTKIDYPTINLYIVKKNTFYWNQVVHIKIKHTNLFQSIRKSMLKIASVNFFFQKNISQIFLYQCSCEK